jgi:hypothetical protein
MSMMRGDLVTAVSGSVESSSDEASSLRCLPSQSNPPEPATIVPRYLALPFPQFMAKLRAPLILLLPVIATVLIPVFPKLGRERLGEKEKSNIIAPGTQVLLYEARFTVGVIVVLLVVLSTTALLRQIPLDIVEIARGGGKERG